MAGTPAHGHTTVTHTDDRPLPLPVRRGCRRPVVSARTYERRRGATRSRGRVNALQARESAFRPSEPPSILASGALLKRFPASCATSGKFGAPRCHSRVSPVGRRARERERDGEIPIDCETSRFSRRNPSADASHARGTSKRAHQHHDVARHRHPATRSPIHSEASYRALSLSFSLSLARTVRPCVRMRAARERTADTFTPLRVRAFPRPHIHAPAAAPRDTTRRDATVPTLRSRIHRHAAGGAVDRYTTSRERVPSAPFPSPPPPSPPRTFANTHGHAAGSPRALSLSLPLSFPLSASRAPARGARGTLRPLLESARISQSCQRATVPGAPSTRSVGRTSELTDRPDLPASLVYARRARNENTHRERERQREEVRFFLLAGLPVGLSRVGPSMPRRGSLRGPSERATPYSGQ